MNPPGAVKQNLQQKVTQQIRKAILSGKLRADAHFGEAQIADMLGVSRSPVREAIKTLEGEGLLETLATGRTIVTGFTPADLSNLYELRFDLEWKAIQSLHKKGAFSFQHAAECEKLLQYMESCTDYHGSYIQLDTLFHRKLVEASGNRPLIRIWTTMIQTILTLQEITNEQIDQAQMNELTKVHRAIYQSIKDGTPRLTKTLLLKHIEQGVDIVTGILEANLLKHIDFDGIR
ncbi:GntR family transcriptional regulator [Paenibacillus sp. BC26]|uniref:GntR family transcriptional regulator n=1 Tax=Paenibacillus sp. BC26 TaxID=1881032 RepID=UPI0008EF201B|nr:GntR family transcriptional regulator [Paenibacillus sp. BC26]SFS68800.1 GntR family transcriptional regulator, vanillate catabolism transcriptional regulator [Paenibacillus sp. BC26]